MSYNFNGVTKLITLTTTSSIQVTDLYSRWKEWVQTDDNSKFVEAFRSVAGDPIGDGQTIAPYIFLNTVDGWKIRPAENNHELRIVGNLYSENSLLTMFTGTLGGYTVNVVIDRSSAALQVSSIDQSNVQLALSAQGFTIARAQKLDNLDASVSTRSISGEGLTISEKTMLLELYRLMGLDPTKPLVVSNMNRSAGAEISQSISETNGQVTITRQ